MEPREITIQPNGKMIVIKTNGNSFKVGDPYLYLIQHDQEERNPIYIGETGKSQRYSIIDRVRYHFQKSKSSTLNRIYKNTMAYDFDMPDNLKGYLFLLPKEYRSLNGTQYRESLESWVIHILCHQLKIQSECFVVTKYSRPNNNTGIKDLAEKIVDAYVSPNQPLNSTPKSGSN